MGPEPPENLTFEQPKMNSNHALVITGGSAVSDDLISDLNQIMTQICGVDLIASRMGDVAIEFRLGEPPVHLLDTVRDRFRDAELDFNIVPCRDRKKALLLSDMDATLIANECIDEIAAIAGIEKQIRDITERTMAGELEFCDSLRARLALFRGLPESVLTEVSEKKLTLNPGAKIVGLTLAKHGVETAIVSGGFSVIVDQVARKIGFKNAFSNLLGIENGYLTGKVIGSVFGPEDKRATLFDQCRKNGIDPVQALCVGDGANDIPMIAAAGMGVAYHAKPILDQNTDILIRHADLTALLYLQGYNQSDFSGEL